MPKKRLLTPKNGGGQDQQQPADGLARHCARCSQFAHACPLWSRALAGTWGSRKQQGVSASALLSVCSQPDDANRGESLWFPGHWPCQGVGRIGQTGSQGGASPAHASYDIPHYIMDRQVLAKLSIFSPVSLIGRFLQRCQQRPRPGRDRAEEQGRHPTTPGHRTCAEQRTMEAGRALMPQKRRRRAPRLTSTEGGPYRTLTDSGREGG